MASPIDEGRKILDAIERAETYLAILRRRLIGESFMIAGFSVAGGFTALSTFRALSSAGDPNAPNSIYFAVGWIIFASLAVGAVWRAEGSAWRISRGMSTTERAFVAAIGLTIPLGGFLGELPQIPQPARLILAVGFASSIVAIGSTIIFRRAWTSIRVAFAVIGILQVAAGIGILVSGGVPPSWGHLVYAAFLGGPLVIAGVVITLRG